MNSFDLIPFPDEIKTLFILVSPHSCELLCGYPFAGTTGVNITKVILKEVNVGFGQMLHNRSQLVKQYRVFNSC